MKNKQINKNKLKHKKAEHDAMIAETVLAISTTSSNVEAMEKLGITSFIFYDRMRKYPELRAVINEFTNNAKIILERSSVKAASKLVDALDDDRKGFEAAKEVLDRVGISKNSDDGKPKTQAVNIQLNIGGKSLSNE